MHQNGSTALRKKYLDVSWNLQVTVLTYSNNRNKGIMISHGNLSCGYFDGPSSFYIPVTNPAVTMLKKKKNIYIYIYTQFISPGRVYSVQSQSQKTHFKVIWPQIEGDHGISKRTRVRRKVWLFDSIHLLIWREYYLCFSSTTWR